MLEKKVEKSSTHEANRAQQNYANFALIDLNFFSISQEGSIGHQLVIRPVPLDVSQSEDGSAHHVVFKRNSDHEMDERLSDFAYMEPDRLQKRYRRSADEENVEERTRSKRAIPHVIYPEILVIVDYDGYRLHGGDNVQVSLIKTTSGGCVHHAPHFRLSDILCRSGTASISAIAC